MSLPSGNEPRQPASGPAAQNIADKRELRRALIRKRLSIDQKRRTEWDAAIGNRIVECLQTHPSSSLGVYWPMRNEPDLLALYARLASQGMILALPLVIEKNAPLEFAAWKPGDPMVEEAFGIMIPEKTEKVPLPGVLLAPCVGFNAARYRLGYGGGFFDRTLARAPRPFSIGVAYSCLEVDFETGEHDIPLDCIITENTMLA